MERISALRIGLSENSAKSCRVRNNFPSRTPSKREGPVIRTNYRATMLKSNFSFRLTSFRFRQFAFTGRKPSVARVLFCSKAGDKYSAVLGFPAAIRPMHSKACSSFQSLVDRLRCWRDRMTACGPKNKQFTKCQVERTLPASLLSGRAPPQHLLPGRFLIALNALELHSY